MGQKAHCFFFYDKIFSSQITMILTISGKGESQSKRQNITHIFFFSPLNQWRRRKLNACFPFTFKRSTVEYLTSLHEFLEAGGHDPLPVQSQSVGHLDKAVSTFTSLEYYII